MAAKIRVLLIDDEQGILDMLRMIFSSEPGFETETLNDVLRWRETLERFRPHVILADFRMPAMSGDQLLSALRASGLRASVRGVALFSASPLTLAQARDFGADSFFEKPFDIPRLLAGVRALARSEERPCAG